MTFLINLIIYGLLGIVWIAQKISGMEKESKRNYQYTKITRVNQAWLGSCEQIQNLKNSLYSHNNWW